MLIRILLTKILAVTMALADPKPGSDTVTSTTHALQACVLRPFDRLYVDVAAQEKTARRKVSKRCQQIEGEISIFCKEEKAECSQVKVRIRE